MDVHDILRRHGIRPSKGLGQNFITDRRILERIVDIGEVDAGDVVLEVGPGVGLLTGLLADRAAAVVAVELDRRMVTVLQSTLAGRDNVRVVQGDILEVDPTRVLLDDSGAIGDGAIDGSTATDAAPTPSYKVVANLPYYITSAVLRHLLEARIRPGRLVLMVQREVAQRIVEPPGRMSLLSISVQIYGEPRIAMHVPAGAFYPRPKVDSAVLDIRVYPQPLVPDDERDRFFRVVSAGFGQKRKQLHNSLTHGLHIEREQVLAGLAAADIDPERRAQTLSIAEWISLTRALPG
jgi:16S rRNA (adenine1518-N6/adenine1519-N6)-dimethyltransferase